MIIISILQRIKPRHRDVQSLGSGHQMMCGRAGTGPQVRAGQGFGRGRGGVEGFMETCSLGADGARGDSGPSGYRLPSSPQGTTSAQ